MRKIVVNKLNLEKETMGYRFDIMDGSEKVISLDIDKSSAKAFLNLVDSSNVLKGHIIQGKILGDRFVTADEINVIQVKSKNQALEVLGKYYYSDKVDLDSVLDGISDTEINSKIREIEGSIDGTKRFASDYELEYDEYGLVPLAKKIVLKAIEGLHCDVWAFEHQDKYSGEFKIEVRFNSLVNLLRHAYNIVQMRRKSAIQDNMWGTEFYINQLRLIFPDGDKCTVDGFKVEDDCCFEEILNGIEKQLPEDITNAMVDSGDVCGMYVTDYNENCILAITEVYIPGYEDDSDVPESHKTGSVWFGIDESVL